MKLIKSMDAGGKMNWIGVRARESITVELIDRKRCGNNCLMRVTDVTATIAKSRAPNDSEWSGRPVKELVTEVGSVEWLDFHNCVVEGVKMSIVKYINNDRPFVDKEETKGHISKVLFPDTPDQLLRWLLVCQEISDNLPSSRFGHMKDSELNMVIQVIGTASLILLLFLLLIIIIIIILLLLLLLLYHCRCRYLVHRSYNFDRSLTPATRIARTAKM